MSQPRNAGARQRGRTNSRKEGRRTDAVVRPPAFAARAARTAARMRRVAAVAPSFLPPAGTAQRCSPGAAHADAVPPPAARQTREFQRRTITSRMSRHPLAAQSATFTAGTHVAQQEMAEIAGERAEEPPAMARQVVVVQAEPRRRSRYIERRRRAPQHAPPRGLLRRKCA